MQRWKKVRRVLLLTVAAFVVGSTFLVVLYQIVPPPITPLMVIRLVEGEGLHKDWVPADAVARDLLKAVMAGEDTRFCDHHGFDWEAIQGAWKRNQKGRRLYGGSTISMQTAKNVFLWPGRSYLRKAFEVYFTTLIELFWSKQRILEIYVNVIEWGHGVYGAEAAARTYFGKPAAKLTRREAALMAAVLPNPRRWSPAKPTGYIARRAATILERMRIMPDPGARICG